MTPLLSFVHSPLVGPLTWEPVAELLRGRGYHVVVPSLVGAVESGPPYYRRLAEQAAEPLRAAVSPVVLVGHSGAGALLPAVAEAAGAPVAAAVFVDALLPHPGQSWLETAPVELRTHLRDLAEDGWLPPWDRWFPPGTVEALLPDAGLRTRFAAELPRLPLAYFEEPAPVVDGWTAPGGYLRLSEAYEDAAAEAERRGWPTVREDADHLAVVTRPDMVAGRIDELVRALTRS